MLKRDFIMVQIEELGKVIAQIIFNRNANAARKNPELIQTVYSSLKLDQDFLMTTSPEEILRSLDNEDNGGVLRLENQPQILLRAKELLEYLQAHDSTFSLERVNLLNEIEERLKE